MMLYAYCRSVFICMFLLFQLISDLDYGAGMDYVVKQQCEYEDAYFYEFNYKSWNDWSPKWMGKTSSPCS